MQVPDLQLTDPLEEEFSSLVQKHDLTYDYSDDKYYWRKGQVEYAAIREFATKLQPGQAKVIWDHWVRRKLTPEGFNEGWLWKGAK